MIYGGKVGGERKGDFCPLHSGTFSTRDRNEGKDSLTPREDFKK